MGVGKKVGKLYGTNRRHHTANPNTLIMSVAKAEVEKKFSDILSLRQHLSNAVEVPTEVSLAESSDHRRLTEGNDWFYTYTTLDANTCSTAPAIASGVLTNTCLVDVKHNDSSVFVTCNSSK